MQAGDAPATAPPAPCAELPQMTPSWSAAVSEYTSVVYLGASELHVAKPDPLTLAGEGGGRRLLAVNGADRGHDLRVRERANLGLERQPVAGQLVDVQVAVGGAPRGLRFQRRRIRANRGAAT